MVQLEVDELLNGEIFYTLREAQIVIESWRRLGEMWDSYGIHLNRPA